MSKALVVVESPTKARTITRFLGPDIDVLSSMGHVRDLPQSSLGIDVNRGFQPVYTLTPNGTKVLGNLKKVAKQASAVYLATDPDREGEAIAWHIKEELAPSCRNASFHRVTFHEITKSAIEAAFREPADLDLDKINAQQARRVLDRLVGYQVSPLLWKNIKKGTSAGRVQSVALRLVCERERQIANFVPVEYSNLDAWFCPAANEQSLFRTRLVRLDNAKPKIDNTEQANALATELRTADFQAAKDETKTVQQSAPPPFITSSLQQTAGSALRLTTSQTMRLAQQLYEGIDIGSEGAIGLITYMRTDSVAVSKEAQERTREYVAERFGADFVPQRPNVFRSRKGAQEAHESIRPTDVRRTPESIANYLGKSQLALYRLIWRRFVASQMASARFSEHTIEVESKGEKLEHTYLFRATARELVFPGYQVLYQIQADTDSDDDDEAEDGSGTLPAMKVGEPALLKKLDQKQRFTEPPKPYTEATLVRELEQNGIGRPSTYASIIGTIQQRGYVTREKRLLKPTPLGFSVYDYLIPNLPELFDINFTARMETKLDEVEAGKVDWTTMLTEFYKEFRSWIASDEPLAAPSNEKAARFMELFPDDLQWAPVRTVGKRKYDDQKFFASLRAQLQEQKKPLTDRQWAALVLLAARYAAQLPALHQVAEELGINAELDACMAKAQKDREGQTAAPDPEDKALLDTLKSVQWDPPVKREKRSYNDKRFYQSLCDQVCAGRRLSAAQKNSLKRLILKYRSQLENFEHIAEHHGIVDSNSAEVTQDPEKTKALIELIDRIESWDAPKKRGRRTYDDKQFAMSVKEQFQRRGALSDRQLAAIRKLLRRYKSHIKDYDKLAAELDLLQGNDSSNTAEKLDVACPQCGAALVERRARGKPFFGCSTFPKCRYAASELPDGGKAPTSHEGS